LFRLAGFAILGFAILQMLVMWGEKESFLMVVK
jgi:hypothetical protein